MTRLQREVLRVVIATFIVVVIWIIYGCAPQPMNAPSSGAVRTGISTAQSQQSTVSQTARQAQRTNDRVDAKDAFLNGYYKWKAAHPGQ